MAAMRSLRTLAAGPPRRCIALSSSTLKYAAVQHPARCLSTATKPHLVLPEPKELLVRGLYNIKYIDLSPTKSPSEKVPTFVFIHGSPGSYQDFKYMIPLLHDHARIVALNLPGNGGSTVIDDRNYYERISAISLAQAAHETIVQLCPDDEHVFIVGHSFGGHATINVTALNELETDAARKVNVRGFALLASAGLRLHRALELGNIGLLWRLLQSRFPFIEAGAKAATRYLFTQIWRFPSRESTEHYVAGLVRCASTDFAVINNHVERIARLPSFFAWAKDDAYIQDHIFNELSHACAPGPRFAFASGGHNIQKTKATFLVHQLLAWTRAVIHEDTPAYSTNAVTIEDE